MQGSAPSDESTKPKLPFVEPASVNCSMLMHRLFSPLAKFETFSTDSAGKSQRCRAQPVRVECLVPNCKFIATRIWFSARLCSSSKVRACLIRSGVRRLRRPEYQPAFLQTASFFHQIITPVTTITTRIRLVIDMTIRDGKPKMSPVWSERFTCMAW